MCGRLENNLPSQQMVCKDSKKDSRLQNEVIELVQLNACLTKLDDISAW